MKHVNASHPVPPRQAETSPIVLGLLAGILAALIGILVVLFQDDREDEGPTGESEPINEPQRIKETLQEGKKNHTVLKVGFDARVTDKDWGLKQVTNLAYVGEMVVVRKIKSNDGHEIKELRHFQTVRNVKVLTEVEDFTIDLGAAEPVLVGALDYIEPGLGSSLVAAKPVAEALLGRGAEAVAQSEATKAFGQIDSLEGKQVRIRYTDGVGIESITPDNCSLTAQERAFVKASAVLSDYHIMPELDIDVGETWTVDGGQFGGFLDPTLRGVPSGQVTIVRESNEQRQGKEYAILGIQEGYLTINASDDKTHRIGRFRPRGTFDYSITDRIVEEASLNGDLYLEEVSKDHLLFESRFEARPQIRVQYKCEIR